MPSENQDHIGRRIAQARRLSGLSQRELGLVIGNPIRTIQTWELGERHPRPKALAAIARATGRPVAWFYEHDEVAA